MDGRFRGAGEVGGRSRLARPAGKGEDDSVKAGGVADSFGEDAGKRATGGRGAASHRVDVWTTTLRRFYEDRRRGGNFDF